jgi:protease-4
MLRFLSTVLAVVIGLFVFVGFFLIIIVGGLAGSAKEKSLPKAIVLELDAREPIGDAPNSISMPAGFGGSQLTVVGIVQALQQARKDPAVKGLYIRTGSSVGVEPGQAEEIRDAIAKFKESGKFVFAHVQDLSDPGLGGYYLASVADQIWMQPSGFIFSQGVATSSLYFKGTLDKVDSSAQVLNYYEYKDAMFPFIHDGPTPSENEENLRLITSIFDSFTTSIAKSRQMTKEQFTSLLAKGPYSGDEAVKSGWVDKLGYDSDTENAATQRAGDDSDVIDLADYARHKGNPYKQGAVIAFIQGEGMIVEGNGSPGLFDSTQELGGDSISKAILDAVDDDEVKAIIFRVDSPGGSATASDQVWNAVAKARAKGKPVIINMSGVAASGGYWVSMGADKIIAEPSTITGSIGVVGAKFVLKGLYDKLGVTSSEMEVGGGQAFMFSEQHPFTTEQWAALKEMFDATYGMFIQKVAEGRKLPVEKVQELAKGRVWSGTDAKERGLVDELGGLETSITAAKELAHIDASASIELRTFPGEHSFIEELFSAVGASAELAHSLSVFANVMRLAPAADIVDGLREREAARTSPVRAKIDPIVVH